MAEGVPIAKVEPPREFAGLFETHLTVAAGPTISLDAIHAVAAGLGLSCTHVVLSRGEHASQLLLSRRGSGLRSEQIATAKALGPELGRSGIQVVRIKVEAALSNADIPGTDEAAHWSTPARYFEHHVKIAWDRGHDAPAIAALAEAHGAHLSRTAFGGRGSAERFVTQRCRMVGERGAADRLADLSSAIMRAGCVIMKIEREFVVHDDNLALDAGWIDG